MILLTLLVTFVTSIATGIITVTLLDQAPAPVSRTINRVVERTIEKVVPSEIVHTNVNTVVIKEEDVIVDAIARGKDALVRVYTGDDVTKKDEANFVTLGTVVSSSGEVVVLAKSVKDSEKYIIDVQGEIYIATFGKVTGSFATLYISQSASTEGNMKTFAGLEYGSVKDMKVGQTILALFREPLAVSSGIVTGSIGSTDSTPETIGINNPLSNKYIGAPVINSDAHLIGLIDQQNGEYVVVPVTALLSAS